MWRFLVFGASAAVMYVVSGTSADLLRNGSFELVPGAHHDQGILPNEWVQTSGIYAGADTYDTTGVYGLWPSEYGHFSGVVAQDGNRWVAGACFGSGVSESFGQLLSAPLVPGWSYELSAQLHASYTLAGMGGFEVFLAPAASMQNAVPLGYLGSTLSNMAWEGRSVVFMAPPGAAELPYLILSPYNATLDVLSYPGIDAVALVRVPEPAPLALLLSAVAFVRQRRLRPS